MQGSEQSAGGAAERDLGADVIDRLLIRELIESWILWRDAGDWDRFATVWHGDGRMNATWFQASAADFIVGCRRAFDAGSVGLHTLGGISIDLRGARAVAHSRMQIVQRGVVHGIAVDVTCLGRFVDAIEKRNGRWVWSCVSRSTSWIAWTRSSPMQPYSWRPSY